ncbi:amidohydrolase family protein [Novosphingobium profundi]|uniref:amidohydrolase family protein n=1 Tax=Novosphingobium profundi TaxID=1774954 RepID=UPI001CFE70D9|nr:amidohydrolase family protein [Novosphingobium profundi]
MSDRFALPDLSCERRGFLRSLCMGASLAALGSGPLLAGCATDAGPIPYSSARRGPRFAVPADACDSHIHILDPRFPARPGWPGSPVGEATVAAYRRFQDRIGTRRTVIVTPSTYGTDNRATLDALRQMGAQARGVAVIDCNAPPPRAELAAMAQAGICGLRVNFVSPQIWGRTDTARLHATARLAQEMGWHIQIFARASQIAAMEADLAALPVPLVIDHLGFVTPQEPGTPEGHGAVLRLLGTRRTWVKLSGAYIASGEGAPDYADLAPIAQAYVAQAPDRLVWGSDWPHRGHENDLPDDARLLDLLDRWAGDARTRDAILVRNPAQLYGFS